MSPREMKLSLQPVEISDVEVSNPAPKMHSPSSIPQTRQQKLAAQASLLPNISRDLQFSKNVKIENHVGFTSIPLGLAGPLKINGTSQLKSPLYGPLATVEPTLIAACSRGCKVFSACDGISTSALTEGLSRAPAFTFSSIPQAITFYHRVPSLFSGFKEVAEKTSRHATLLSANATIIGKAVHIKFTYSCGDAAGQNMVTLATHSACSSLIEKNRPEGMIAFQLDGNLSSDKKISWGSVLEPRGVSVMAWGTISNVVSQKILGCSTKKLKTVYERFEEGSVRNGTMAHCLNTSNIVAAMFMACGQDVGSVLESGWSQLTLDLDEETQDLTLCLFFPSLLVGSVGGGTGYATQREALELIGCFGSGKKWALAETVAAFCLALEISTLAAMANDTFAASHKELARGGKTSKL